MGLILKKVIAIHAFWTKKAQVLIQNRIQVEFKAEMQKEVYLVINDREIRGQNEKGLFKCFKHVTHAGDYYNYSNIKYLTIYTNWYHVFPNKEQA